MSYIREQWRENRSDGNHINTTHLTAPSIIYLPVWWGGRRAQGSRVGGGQALGLLGAVRYLPPPESLLVCILGHARWFGVMLMKSSRTQERFPMSLIWGRGSLKTPGGQARVSCALVGVWGGRPLSPLQPSGAASGSLLPRVDQAFGRGLLEGLGGQRGMLDFPCLPGLPATLDRRNADSQEGMAHLMAQMRKNRLARMFSCFYPWISQQ